MEEKAGMIGLEVNERKKIWACQHQSRRKSQDLNVEGK
jgi:hypothetical protein